MITIKWFLTNQQKASWNEFMEEIFAFFQFVLSCSRNFNWANALFRRYLSLMYLTIRNKWFLTTNQQTKVGIINFYFILLFGNTSFAAWFVNIFFVRSSLSIHQSLPKNCSGLHLTSVSSIRLPLSSVFTGCYSGFASLIEQQR